MMEDTDEHRPTKKIRRRFTKDQAHKVILSLMQGATPRGKPARGRQAETARQLGIKADSVSRIWKRFEETGDLEDLRSRNKRPKKYSPEEVKRAIMALPAHRRKSYRHIAAATGIPACTIIRLKKAMGAVWHRNRVIPKLTEDGRRKRIDWALGLLETRNPIPGASRVQNMENFVHVDEKWFDKEKPVEKYLLFPGEDKPRRPCNHKSHMPKVMFVAACARPRFDESGNCTFDGKIGLWPLTELVPAKRSTKNRSAGTLEPKPISMTADVCRKFLITQLLPALKRSWPRRRGEVIYVQLDNARPHIPDSDPAWREAVADTRMDVRIVFQPPNSPDTNVLDLGIFRHLQRITYHLDAPSRNLADIISAVEQAWEMSDAITREKVFVTLQGVLLLILQLNGRNDFDIPHMGKDVKKNRQVGTGTCTSGYKEVLVPNCTLSKARRSLKRVNAGYALESTRVLQRLRTRAPTPLS